MPDALRVVITGASSDIGSVLARRLDAAGAELVLVSRSGKAPALGRPHAALEGVDLSSAEGAARVGQAAEARFQGPFALVHCVGGFWEHRPLVHTRPDDIAEMITGHYLTLAFTARSLLPLMLRAGGGRIVAFSCNSVAYNYPDMAPFTAAKAAVETFIKCTANEYAEFGVAANALALPTVLTPKVLAAKPTGDPANYVTPEEIAEMVVQIVSASPHIVNGNVVKVFKPNPSFFGEGYFTRNPRPGPITP